MKDSQNEILLRIDQMKKSLVSKLDHLNLVLNTVKKEDKKYERFCEKHTNHLMRVICTIETIPGLKEALEQEAKYDAEKSMMMKMLGKAT